MSLSIFRALAASTIAVAVMDVAWTSNLETLYEYRQFFLDPSELSEAAPGDGTIRVTFLGTTTLLFDDGQTQLMLDGFLTRPRFTTVAFKRVETDKKLVGRILDRVLDQNKDIRLQALFVSHSHYDHALDAAYVAELTGAHLYGSRSTLKIGRGGGLCEAQMTQVRPGETWSAGAFLVTILRSRHSPPTPFNDDIGTEVDAPLTQPTRAAAYREGGTVDFLITHRDRRMLVKSSANFFLGALDDIRADVLFLAIAQLGKQDEQFMNDFYEETVAKVHPRLVVPLHWDDFFAPLTGHLPLAPWLVDDTPDAFDFLIARMSAENAERSPKDRMKFRIMQGYQSILLFKPGNREGSPL